MFIAQAPGSISAGGRALTADGVTTDGSVQTLTWSDGERWVREARVELGLSPHTIKSEACVR